MGDKLWHARITSAVQGTESAISIPALLRGRTSATPLNNSRSPSETNASAFAASDSQ
jgi:hypothetical protein